MKIGQLLREVPLLTESELPAPYTFSHRHLEQVSHPDLLNIVHDVLIILQMSPLMMLIIPRLPIRL